MNNKPGELGIIVEFVGIVTLIVICLIAITTLCQKVEQIVRLFQ